MTVELKTIETFYDEKNICLTWAQRHYRQMLGQYYQRYIPKNVSVLEVGCGDGELLTHLNNCRITGVDISMSQIALAKAKVPSGTFKVQAGENLHFDKKFDYIILSETINQASDVQKIF